MLTAKSCRKGDKNVATAEHASESKQVSVFFLDVQYIAGQHIRRASTMAATPTMTGSRVRRHAICHLALKCLSSVSWRWPVVDLRLPFHIIYQRTVYIIDDRFPLSATVEDCRCCDEENPLHYSVQHVLAKSDATNAGTQHGEGTRVQLCSID